MGVHAASITHLQHVSPVCEVRGVSGGRIPTSTHDAIRHPAWWDAPLRKRLQYLSRPTNISHGAA